MLQLTKNKLLLVISIILLTAVSMLADTIVLKDGGVLQGLFKGATQDVIIFEVDGKVENINIVDIVSITFTRAAASNSQTSQGKESPQTSATVAVATGVTSSDDNVVPKDTKLMIKLDKDVSTATHKVGSMVTGLLELDLIVNGKVISSKGSAVYGKVVEAEGGRKFGTHKLVLTFDGIVVKGQKVSIKTGHFGAEVGPDGSVIKTAAAGAAIGAAFGGGSGAGKGAAVAGGLALLKKSKHITIPAGTMVEITLLDDVNLK